MCGPQSPTARKPKPPSLPKPPKKELKKWHDQADARQAAGLPRTPPKQLKKQRAKQRAAVVQECRCSCGKAFFTKRPAWAKHHHKKRCKGAFEVLGPASPRSYYY